MTEPVLFELISSESVRVQGDAYKVHAPSLTSRQYILEGTADRTQQFAQFLPPRRLQGVTASCFPNNFHFSIERLGKINPQFRYLNFAIFNKEHDQLTLKIFISLDFADWFLPENLIEFVERYRTNLVAAIGRNTLAFTERHDAGVDIECAIPIDADEDIYSVYLLAFETSLQTYRAGIAKGYTTPSTSKPETSTVLSSSSIDTSGHKWWVRYVLVPLLGSGAFAAIIVALFALLR